MKIKWISVKKVLPRLGDEYLVVYDLEDGDKPLVTSMDWDAINKVWTDPRGNDKVCNTVLYWAKYPETPKISINN